MARNFRAFFAMSLRNVCVSGFRRGLQPLAAVLVTLGCAAALAEKADSGKPMEVVADKSGTADLKAQVSRFNGNVVITQGTMTIKADRVEIRQTPDGYYMASAWGTPERPVTYRQKRDGAGAEPAEWVEGSGERVEFDGKAEVLRFIGRGVVRRWREGPRGNEVVDEITGASITWNHADEQFAVSGGAGASAPEGRARAVFTPPAGSSAAARADGSRPAKPARTASEPR
jgi:lipopolysaccharide export system protein LptA